MYSQVRFAGFSGAAKDATTVSITKLIVIGNRGSKNFIKKIFAYRENNKAAVPVVKQVND